MTILFPGALTFFFFIEQMLNVAHLSHAIFLMPSNVYAANPVSDFPSLLSSAPRIRSPEALPVPLLPLQRLPEGQPEDPRPVRPPQALRQQPVPGPPPETLAHAPAGPETACEYHGR